MDDLPSGGINSGHSPTDAADEFIVEAATLGGDLLSSNGFLPIPTHQNHDVIHLNIGNRRHVHHHLIHADAPQNGGLFSTDEHIEPAG